MTDLGGCASSLGGVIPDGLYGLIAAKKVYPELLCHTCGRAEILTKDEMAECFARGWPECHGQMMSLRLVKADD